MLDLLFVTTVSSFSSKKSKTWKTNFKPSCHIRFPHAFSALRCVFIIITFFHRHQQTKVSNKNLTNNHTQLYCYLISFSLDKMRIGKVTFNTVFFCQAISATTSALTNSIRLKKNIFESNNSGRVLSSSRFGKKSKLVSPKLGEFHFTT